MKTQQHRFKGSYIKQVQTFVDETLGAGAFQSRFKEYGKEWDSPILIASWYEADALNKGLRKVAAELKLDYPQMVTDLAGRTSRADLPTLYRVFFKVMSPGGVLRFMPQLWKSYCTHGVMEVVSNEPGVCVVDTLGIPDWLVEFTTGSVKGFINQVVILTDGKVLESRSISATPIKDGEWAGYHTIRAQVKYVAKGAALSASA